MKKLLTFEWNGVIIISFRYDMSDFKITKER